jgi:hypothetical protein
VAAGGTPRSVVVAVVLAALVAAGALGGAAAIRWRAAEVATGASVSPGQVPGQASDNDCHAEPCQVLAAATVRGMTAELIADAGGRAGRLRIGGPSSGHVIETTITDMGVTLTAGSLVCVDGVVSACLIRGAAPNGAAGEVVVGRSENWTALERPYLSGAGYLALANIVEDTTPEVVAVQRDCGGAAPEECARRPVFAQVFALGGEEKGCTRNYNRMEQLPGYPDIHPTPPQLRKCT